MDDVEWWMCEFWGNELVCFWQEIYDVFVDGLKCGQGIDQMSKCIQDWVGVSCLWVLLIVCNEVGNVVVYVMQKSQVQVGCVEYIWCSVKDCCVWFEYVKWDGKCFFWDDLLLDGYFGELINCWCVVLVVILGEQNWQVRKILLGVLFFLGVVNVVMIWEYVELIVILISML